MQFPSYFVIHRKRVILTKSHQKLRFSIILKHSVFTFNLCLCSLLTWARREKRYFRRARRAPKRSREAAFACRFRLYLAKLTAKPTAKLTAKLAAKLEKRRKNVHFSLDQAGSRWVKLDQAGNPLKSTEIH